MTDGGGWGDGVWRQVRSALFTLALTVLVLRALVWLITPLAAGIVSLAVLGGIAWILTGRGRGGF